MCLCLRNPVTRRHVGVILSRYNIHHRLLIDSSGIKPNGSVYFPDPQLNVFRFGNHWNGTQTRH